MQSTSRESLLAVREWFESQLRDADESTLWTLGDELGSVTALLARERPLRRALADSSTEPEARQSLVSELFANQIAAASIEALRKVAAARWSNAQDVLSTVELLGRLPMLAVAERAGNTDEIEDELFRFERILDSDPRLERLLSDEQAAADQRIGLLDNLISEKVKPATRELLAQLVRTPRGRELSTLVTEVAELAAARREESIAHVTAAAALSTAQEQRLGDVLSRIYGRRVSVRVDIDPDVVGGLVVRIGDEVIDGSLASKLAKARQELHG